jgi:hypothetical protein
MIKLTNYYLNEENDDFEQILTLNSNCEQEFNGLYIVFEDGKLTVENQTYDKVEVPTYILDDISEINDWVQANGDDVTVFDSEVEDYIRNNGFSIKRTSNGDFGRYLYV